MVAHKCFISFSWFRLILFPNLSFQNLTNFSPIPIPSEAPILKAGACCIWSLQTGIDVCDRAGIVMTEDETGHVCTYWLSFLQHWQGLFQIFQGAGIERWKMRPKHHYFFETIKQIRRTQLNVRYVSCWQDESYLGHVKKIAIHSHGGNAILRTFQRLMINLSRRFKNTRDHAKQVEQFGCPKVAAPTWMIDSLPV